jgi:hypothetical protein
VCHVSLHSPHAHTLIKNHSGPVIQPWIHGIVESTTTLIGTNVAAAAPHSQIDQSGVVKVNMYVYDHTPHNNVLIDYSAAARVSGTLFSQT